jgi:hypothetical protein
MNKKDWTKRGTGQVYLSSLNRLYINRLGLDRTVLPLKGGGGSCLVQLLLLGLEGKRYFERLQAVRIAKQRRFLLVG